MTLSLRSSSARTFIGTPLVAAVEQIVARRSVRRGFLPFAAAGYALYRFAGEVRRQRGGGGPGMGVPPDRLVTSGVYAVSRNPMYLGHVIFLASILGATRSRAAAGLAAAQVLRLRSHALEDEARLAELFGGEYRRYTARVPRWFALPRGRNV